MKTYTVNLNENLSNWLRQKKHFPQYTSFSAVIRDCIIDYKDREEGKRKEEVDLKRAYKSMDDQEIRDYVKRARRFSTTTAINLKSEDAERVIVELDNARVQRDMLDMKVRALVLEINDLRRENRDLKEAVDRWIKRYMAASNPENVEIGG